MHKIYLVLLVVFAGVLFHSQLQAQCLVSVNAGEDRYLCDNPPQFVQIDGQINGPILQPPYTGIYWYSPTGLTGVNIPSIFATVQQTSTYVLEGVGESATNVAVNGDFESGNTGFTSKFIYSPGDLSFGGLYDVTPLVAGFPTYCTDHSGTGNMLIFSYGTHATPELTVWSQDIPVTPNADYIFSFWVTNFVNPSPGISMYVNGANILAPSAATNSCNKWTKYSAMFHNTNLTTAMLELRLTPQTAFAYPRLMAIDDIVFSPICHVRDSVTIHMIDVKAVANPKITQYPPCSTATVTLSGAGSSVGPEYEYHWDTPDGNIVSGENTLTAVVDAPGTYTLSVTYLNGEGNCTETSEVVVVENVSPLTANANVVIPLSCQPGTATIIGTANIPGNTYAWTAGPGGNIVSGANSAGLIVNQPGQYFLTVTNVATGCTSEAVAEVAAPVQPVANATTSALSCAQQQTTLSGAGSSTGPNFTYTWTTPNGHIASGQDSIFAVADAPGMYILSVAHKTNHCVKKDTVIVVANTALPIANILPAETITCQRSLITLSVDTLTSTGSNYTYAWTASSGGNIVSGADSLAPVVNAPGFYVLQITNTANACSTTDTVQVVANTEAVIAIANAPSTITCTQGQVSLDASGSSTGASLVYQWSTANGHIVSGGNTPSPIVDAPGTYSLLITNPANGCSATDLADVTQNTTPPNLQATATANINCTTPAQTLDVQNSAGNFTYVWTVGGGGHIQSGATTLTPTVDAGGTYSLLATNQDNGCTASTTVTVSADFALPGASVDVPGNLNCHNAFLNLSSNSTANPALLSHSWTYPDGTTTNTGTSASLNVTEPGLYSLVVTNTQNGCTSTASGTVVHHDNVTAALSSQTDVTCFGDDNGAVSISAAGGDGNLSYLWNGGATGTSLTQLVAGTYTVTVTDGENCTATVTAVISEPLELQLSAFASATSSAGVDDGTANAVPSGGTPPYTYAWDNGETTATITDLAPDFYTVVVTDANGCTNSQTVQVEQGGVLCVLSNAIQSVNPSCNGLSNGQATINLTGGTPPFTYAWSSGSNAQTAINLSAGTYTATVTDLNGCQTAGEVTLSEPTALVIELDATTNTSCPNDENGTATVAAGGGTGAISIEWEDGQTGPTAIGLAAGTYTATATDENGCTATITATIVANDQVPPVVQGGPVTLALGTSGQVTLTMLNLGATASDNCSLSGVQISPDVFNCTQLGDHQVTLTATDAAGNTATHTVTVTIVDNQAPVLACSNDIVRCSYDNTVQYDAPVATDNCLGIGSFFSLTEGLLSGSVFPEGQTVVAYSLTDAQGNVGTCSFVVTVLTPLATTLEEIINDIDHQNIGGIQVSVDGSQAPYTYEWQLNGQTVGNGEDLTGVGEGVYTLIITDGLGCTSQAGPFEVSNIVGTDNPSWSDRVSIFPNPTTGEVFVLMPNELVKSALHFVVVDATGRRILEQEGEGKKLQTLDLSAFADGLYSILIQVEGQQSVYRIVVSK